MKSRTILAVWHDRDIQEVEKHNTYITSEIAGVKVIWLNSMLLVYAYESWREGFKKMDISAMFK